MSNGGQDEFPDSVDPIISEEVQYHVGAAGHHDEFPGADYAKVNQDVLRSLTETTWKYYLALGILGAIVVAGIGLYYYQTVYGLGVWGVNEPNYWGLDIPTFIFWIGFSLSGTLLSAILLLTKSHWRNPIYRTAELMTGFALMTAGVVVLTHMGRPWRFWYTMPYPNLRGLWTNFRSPLTSDILGMVAYLVASLTFLIIGSIPDFAALRDHTTGWRRPIYRVLAFGWKGTDKQWRHFRRTYLLIACFIIPIAVSMHSVTSWVPSMTINPGAHSTIYPMYFVVGALLSGVAGVIMIVILVRKYLKFQDYIQPRHIDNLAKLLLLASLLISYIYLLEIFVPSFKPENFEFIPLLAKLTGKYAPLYWTMVFFNAIVPLTLFSQKVRRNLPALFGISVGVQLAMYFERLLMVIPSQTVGPLPSTWAAFTPSWVELLLLVWELSFFAFLMLGSIKIIPALSIFETKELLPVPMRADADPADEVVVATQPVAEFDGSSRHGRRESGGLGVFRYLDDALIGVKELKNLGFNDVEVQSPVLLNEIDEATRLNLKGAGWWKKWRARDIQVVRFSAVGAVSGMVGMILLAGGTAVAYPVPGGGLPILSLPTIAWNTAVFTALAGLLGSVVGLFVLAKLPSYKLGIYSSRTSDEAFAVVFRETDAEKIAIGRDVLKSSGAQSVEEIVR